MYVNEDMTGPTTGGSDHPPRFLFLFRHGGLFFSRSFLSSHPPPTLFLPHPHPIHIHTYPTSHHSPIFYSLCHTFFFSFFSFSLFLFYFFPSLIPCIYLFGPHKHSLKLLPPTHCPIQPQTGTTNPHQPLSLHCQHSSSSLTTTA